jgi:hypothetical protein
MMNPPITHPALPDIYEQNYHTLIGEEFIKLRGFGFALSPHDMRLIDAWEAMGVPVFIPLTVMEEIGERRSANQQRPRKLAYIQEEVEARFAELIEGHVGCGGCGKPYCAGVGTMESGVGSLGSGVGEVAA